MFYLMLAQAVEDRIDLPAIFNMSLMWRRCGMHVTRYWDDL